MSGAVSKMIAEQKDNCGKIHSFADIIGRKNAFLTSYG
jgi:hypothetical protein